MWSVPCHPFLKKPGYIQWPHQTSPADVPPCPPRSPHVPFVEHLPSCVGGTRKPQDRSSPKTGAWCVFGKAFILLVVSSQNVKFNKKITHASVCIYIYIIHYTFYIIHFTLYIIHIHTHIWPEVKEVRKWQDVFLGIFIGFHPQPLLFNMIPIIHVHYYYYRTSVIYDPYVISSVLFIMMINLDWENILCNILAWGHLEFIIIRSEVLMSLLKMILWMGK